MYYIKIYKDGALYTEGFDMADGDSFVFDTPSTFLTGKNAILRWKLDRANKQIETLHRLLDEARLNVDLREVSVERMMNEISNRMGTSV